MALWCPARGRQRGGAHRAPAAERSEARGARCACEAKTWVARKHVGKGWRGGVKPRWYQHPRCGDRQQDSVVAADGGGGERWLCASGSAAATSTHRSEPTGGGSAVGWHCREAERRAAARRVCRAALQGGRVPSGCEARVRGFVGRLCVAEWVDVQRLWEVVRG